MPFRFFAHQLPVLPIAHRLRGKVDGLALVTGSIAPDLAYAFWFTPLSFDSHTLLAQLWWSLPVGVFLAICTRRYLIAPVASLLPDLPPLHLHDYQFIATRKKAILLTCGCVFFGALTHIFLDSFTHSNGYIVRHWDSLQQKHTFFHHTFPTYQLLQYAGHTIGSLSCFFLLCSYGKTHWLKYGTTPHRLRSFPKKSFLFGALIAGILSAFIALTSWQQSSLSASIRSVWVLYVGLLVTAIFSRNKPQSQRIKA